MILRQFLPQQKTMVTSLGKISLQGARVLLITSTMSSFNYDVSAVDVAVASIIMAVLAFLVTAIQFVLYDRKLLRKFGKKEVK